MIGLKIDKGYVAIAIDLMANDNFMKHTIKRVGDNIVINKNDMERADKLLERRMIPYKFSKL